MIPRDRTYQSGMADAFATGVFNMGAPAGARVEILPMVDSMGRTVARLIQPSLHEPGYGLEAGQDPRDDEDFSLVSGMADATAGARQVEFMHGAGPGMGYEDFPGGAGMVGELIDGYGTPLLSVPE